MMILDKSVIFLYIFLFLLYSYSQEYYYRVCKTNFIMHLLLKDSFLCSGLKQMNMFIEKVLIDPTIYLKKYT